MGKAIKEAALAGILFLILIISSSFGSAVTQKFFLEEGISTMFQGKNISLTGIQEGIASYYVDGIFFEVRKGESIINSGVEINLVGYSMHPTIAITNITINFVCGDSTCASDQGEDTNSCCNDCGCPTREQACINNICAQNITLPVATYQCQVDEDCLPEHRPLNDCFIRTCDKTVTPYRCATRDLTTCVAGDNCCPLQCTAESDRDCATIDLCKLHKDCDDHNPCTIDACEGTPLRCHSSDNGGCIVGEQCIPLGGKEGVKYCSYGGTLRFMSELGTSCTEDYECFTDSCRFKKCSTPLTENIFFYSVIVVFAALIGIIIFYLSLAIKRRNQE